LTALKNVDEIAPLITEDDEHVLANLIDIRLEYLLENPVFTINVGISIGFCLCPERLFYQRNINKDLPLCQARGY
jgi:hypothetical protein